MQLVHHFESVFVPELASFPTASLPLSLTSHDSSLCSRRRTLAHHCNTRSVTNEERLLRNRALVTGEGKTSLSEQERR